MRKVVLHYHLFKNAGTSLDAAFKENFKGSEWVTKEFPGNLQLNKAQVEQWIFDNPQAKCFSSHTALLPPPEVEGVKVFPVIFVRHPLDRIASAYAFERKQGGDSFGAVLARNTDLKGYIETRLSLPNDRQCRNFHVARLAQMFSSEKGSELDRAREAVQELPFVGLVEQFDRSIFNLESCLRNFGIPNVKLETVRKNISRAVSKSLDQKLIEIERELGGEVYRKLVECNASDLALYEYLRVN
ncbi:sulfotransferase family 2 domain-containing protein [Microbulbifer sp. JTAC008]|uniref:sulfotransferase family 2 domain-containing protein n=1 Tax=unclassified Microbulbifer TaxID=2619833 RepID=UPI004039B46A